MNRFADIFNDYENTILKTEKDFSDGSLNVVNYDELKGKDVVGTLKASYYEADKLKQIYSQKDNHTCVVAATRQGKTTCVVIPMVLSNAVMKIKRNMVITDPKAEIYHNTAATLKKQGYRIILINFRDYSHSSFWNPLTPIFRRYMEYRNVVNEVELVQTENGFRNKFRGKIYQKQSELNRDIKITQNGIMDEVSNKIDEFARHFITIKSRQDPIWEMGARDIVKGVMYAMLEDVDYKPNPITEEKYSINNLIMILGTFGKTYNGYEYFKRRSKDSLSYQYVRNYLIDIADNTRSSYLSVLFSKLSEFREITTRRITSCNSFEFDVFTDSKQPTALFIDFKDESAGDGHMIALFIQQLYSHLIEYTNHCHHNRLERAVHFIVDEFGNMPKLDSFKRVVSACGARNIWFNIILQSYAQLESVYEADAEIIKDNMNVHIFMGSNNIKTLEAFSKECGMYTRYSPLSALNGKGKEIDAFQLETIPIMPVSRLANLKTGECVVTEVNCGYVMLSKLEPYYKCKEFNSLPFADEKEYICSVNPLDDRYNYDISGI